MRNVTRQPCETRTLRRAARAGGAADMSVATESAAAAGRPMRTGSLAAAEHAPDPRLWYRCGCAAAQLRTLQSSVSPRATLQQDMLWILKPEAVIAAISFGCPRQQSLAETHRMAKSQPPPLPRGGLVQIATAHRRNLQLLHDETRHTPKVTFARGPHKHREFQMQSSRGNG